MSSRREALVIGAGVIGMTTAYALARRGLAVTIVDAAPEPARGASFANGAQLSYVYTDALASPGLLRQLPRLLVAADPAFRLRPSADPDFLRWGLAFLRNCTDERFRAHTMAGLELGLESRLAMHALLERHPLQFAHATAGKLHLISGHGALRAARRLVRLKREGGAEQHVLSPRDAVRLEPALAGRATALSGVIYSPQEEVGDPYLFCRGLLAMLTRDYGVAVRFGTAVRAVERVNGHAAAALDGGERIEAERIAICTGAETPQLLKGTGIRAPIWPMKGYSITAAPGPEAPRVSITDVARRLVFCRLNGSVRIAGLADLGTRDTAVSPRRLARLVEAARSSLPGAIDYDRIGSSWCGLRPMTPSSLPIIRREQGGIVLNVGHGTLGWTFAMGAAERAADLAMERAA
jgi:D-amino-acid dehydrogenase